MTKPTQHNPPADTDAPKPGRALRVARLVIAVGLLAGIAVFSVMMIEALKAGPPTNDRPNDFGASSTTNEPKADSGSPLAGLGRVNPKNYPPILRPNPHPGEFTPFLKAPPHGMPHYQNLGGEIWEHANYNIRDASLTDLIAHYDKQAKLRGLTLTKQHPTTANRPGGIVVAWTDGPKSLHVTAWPLRSTEPVQPPLAPPTPLQWVVKYSYPAPPPESPAPPAP